MRQGSRPPLYLTKVLDHLCNLCLAYVVVDQFPLHSILSACCTDPLAAESTELPQLACSCSTCLGLSWVTVTRSNCKCTCKRCDALPHCREVGIALHLPVLLAFDSRLPGFEANSADSEASRESARDWRSAAAGGASVAEKPEYLFVVGVSNNIIDIK